MNIFKAIWRKLMGGEKEMTVEKPKSKSGDSAEKTDVGAFRIHINNGEVHVHDDADKMKAAVPVSAWWKMWDRLRNEPGSWVWLDPTHKTKLTIETALDGQSLGVRISVASISIHSDWDKLNNFSKRK